MEIDMTVWKIMGGAAGLLAGIFAGLALGVWRTGHGRVAGTGFTAGLAILGSFAAPALAGLAPALAGGGHPDSAQDLAQEPGQAADVESRFDRALETVITRELAGNPVFGAIERVAPERATAWRESVMAAYREGGLAAGRAANLRISEEMGGWIAAEYAPRASDEALLAFYTEMFTLIAGTLNAEPRACYAFLFGNSGNALSASDLAALDDAVRPFADRTAGLVDGAAGEPLPYDLDRAAAVQASAAEAAASRIGEDNLPLLGERTPAGASDYQLACEGMAAYLGAILDAEGRVDALRDFAAGPG